jgi:DNA-binding response OmpR family regulator
VRRVCKVVVVEDDPYVRELLGDLFAHEGYHFAVARDGVEMRSIMSADPAVDIVIIDVTLPGKDNGLTLAKEAVRRGCGVILVSGDHSQFDAVEQSGHRFLFKPFRIQSLLALIDEVLATVKRDCELPPGQLRVSHRGGNNPGSAVA